MYMNKSEKQRAKLLEKLLVHASPICSMKILMGLTVVLSAVSYAVLFMITMKSNELWVPIWVGVFIAFTFSVDFCFIGSMFDSKNGVFKSVSTAVNGAYNIVEFAATLPLKATDMLYYRLARCKEQALTMGVLTSACIASVKIAGCFGYETYDGMAGIAVLTTIILEIIFIITNIICRHSMRGMFITAFLSVAALFCTMFLFETPDDVSAEQAAEISVKFGGLSVLSGVTGIIILAAALFAVVIIAEFFVSRVKNISWKLD